LRLREGVSFSDFQVRFAVALEQVFADQTKELRDLRLVEVNGDALRLTGRGRLLRSEVFERFLPARAG
ncbi:MAG: oxygen-independent coproporphyrinogen III oxidase, partial [Anaerolineae bacterium]